MKEYWNHRYSQEDYAYGTKPNEFFKSQIDQLKPGKILFPAEGEGRNAVYAALNGWEVYAFDISEEGKRKAEKLAERAGVTINYDIAAFDDIKYEDHFFNVIALIYAHVPKEKRRIYHRKIEQYLKVDGLLILEGFSKNQFQRTTGGPKNIDVLFSGDELRVDFSEIKRARIREEEVILNEGYYHQGMSSVIRFVGQRQNTRKKVIEKIPQEANKNF